MLGFTRSFLSAGSSALIVSLWPVADDTTEVLMDTLYSELAKGTDLMDAMQAAQLRLLNATRVVASVLLGTVRLIGNWRLTVGG